MLLEVSKSLESWQDFCLKSRVSTGLLKTGFWRGLVCIYMNQSKPAVKGVSHPFRLNKAHVHSDKNMEEIKLETFILSLLPPKC